MAFRAAYDVMATRQGRHSESGRENPTARAAAAAAAGGSIIVPPTPAWVALHTGDAAAAAAAGAASGILVTSEEERQQHQGVAMCSRYTGTRGGGGEQQQQRKENNETKAVFPLSASSSAAAGATSSSTLLVAACGLSQWALDFEGNCIRVEESMRRAQAAGASIRVGPELELCGYSCEDHLLEEDTFQHSWESLAALLSTNATDNLLCEVGIAVSYKSVFGYIKDRGTLALIYGMAVLECLDCIVGSIFFEELDAVAASTSGVQNIAVSLVCEDVDILCCGAAAHFEVGKYEKRLRTIQQASRYCVTVYSNQHGCDGGRLFFDGTAAICAGGEILGIAPRFSFEEIQVVAAAVDIRDLRALRASAPIAWKQKQPQQRRLPVIHADIFLCGISSSPTTSAGLAAATASLASPPAAIPVPLPLPPPSEPAAATDTTQSGHTIYVTVQQQQQQQQEQQSWWGRYALPRVSAEEETARTAACWLWDCLRRSGARGYFLALSGGADSAAVAAIVALMCKGIINEVSAGHVDVVAALERVLRCRCRRTPGTKASPNTSSSNTSNRSGSMAETGVDTHEEEEEGGGGGGESDEEFRLPVDAKELCHALLYTCYMSTHHSSIQTRSFAASLAEQLGSFHLAVGIDAIVTAFANVMTSVCGSPPRFIAEGGTTAEDIALQNIQARIRMCLAYFMAQLLPPSAFSSSRSPLELRPRSAGEGEGLGERNNWDSNVDVGSITAFAATHAMAGSTVQEKREGSSFLLVLGTANADEGLRGYFTKYDASSADINPIGSMGKVALRRLLLWAAQPTVLACPALYDIAAQAPTAELRPATLDTTSSDGTLRPQTDEEDMGMTYKELADYGRLRKTQRCGPVSMFNRLLREWRGSGQSPQPSTIAQKVVHFFTEYGRHRHKTCTVTPALHVDPSDAEDSRFDPRPFLYPPWNVQFEQIRKIALQLESSAPIYGASYAQFRS